MAGHPFSDYVGRFAPSPTGPLHFGSLIAALASFLQARTRGGRWLLRIEDIDQPRVVPKATEWILRSLKAHGLEPDGPPLYQSQHQPAYREALAQLQQQGLVYACACTRRAIRDAAPLGPYGAIYPGTCRQQRLPWHHGYAIRLRTDNRAWGFTDRLQGHFSQRLAAEVGDFVLRRSDGLFAYQLAVVVDDHAQGITEIVRGADLLDSTPRQCYLQHCLGLPTPEYLHLPVAIAPCGTKLSKQTGAPGLDDAKAPAQLCAALTHLGHPPPLDPLRASVDEILQWALAHWEPQRIPAQRALPAPQAASL